MELELSGASLTSVSFAPATEIEEIVQNVKTVLATPVYSVVMDRAFGIEAAVDRPAPVAMELLRAAYVTAINKYEPRAKVQSVTFTGDSNGKLVPTVRIEVNP